MKDRIDPLVLEQIGHLRAGRSPINIVIGK
jgi:hypothetical protein